MIESLQEKYGTTDPWKIMQIRKKEYQDRMEAREQVGWVELDGDARVPDDDTDREYVVDEAGNKVGEVEEPSEAGETDEAGERMRVNRDLRAGKKVWAVSFAFGVSEEWDRRLLLRKIQEAVQSCGGEPIFSTVKEVGTQDDLADSRSEFLRTAGALGVRGQERPGAGG